MINGADTAFILAANSFIQLTVSTFEFSLYVGFHRAACRIRLIYLLHGTRNGITLKKK